MNLETTYLGLQLKNPLVHSASPLSRKLDNIRALEDSGASAVVLYSLFEEQLTQESLRLDEMLEQGSGGFGEAFDFIPEYAAQAVGPQEYLDHIAAAKLAVDIPIIASLNGTSESGWVSYAKMLEEAGADAIELNLYQVPTNTAQDAIALEQQYIHVIESVKKVIQRPLAVKLSPFFTSPAHFCQQAQNTGADALVLFNRFYQPDIDLETLEMKHDLDLSTSSDLRLPLRWTAMLSGSLDADIAITSGVHKGEDTIKGILCGAAVTMMTSAVLKKGPKVFKKNLETIAEWMEENDYESIAQMRGALCKEHLSNPASLERANYLKVLGSYEA